MSFFRLSILGFATVSLLHCSSSRDPIDPLVKQLSKTETRRSAIDRLLALGLQSRSSNRALVERIADALMVAYRDDEDRLHLVAALAQLPHPKAETVFVSALNDWQRGDDYYQAAIVAAENLSTSPSVKAAKTLTSTLVDALNEPVSKSSYRLELALLRGLESIAIPDVAPSLFALLKRVASFESIELASALIQTLGRINAPHTATAILDVVQSDLGAVLFAPLRRASCSLRGNNEAELRRELLHRITRIDSATSTQSAPSSLTSNVFQRFIAILGDLGHRSVTADLKHWFGSSTAVSSIHTLALVETLLRLGEPHNAMLPTLHTLIDDKTRSESTRLAAIDLVGWYGDSTSAATLLSKTQSTSSLFTTLEPAHRALAFARSGTGPSQQKWIKAHTEYGDRLEIATVCKDNLDCWLRALTTSPRWRQQERAALHIGKFLRRKQLATSETVRAIATLVDHFSKATSEVQTAILVALEPQDDERLRHLALRKQRLTAHSGKDVSEEHRFENDLFSSRTFCFDQRLDRIEVAARASEATP